MNIQQQFPSMADTLTGKAGRINLYQNAGRRPSQHPTAETVVECSKVSDYQQRAMQCDSQFVLALLVDDAERNGIRIDPVTRTAREI